MFRETVLSIGFCAAIMAFINNSVQGEGDVVIALFQQVLCTFPGVFGVLLRLFFARMKFSYWIIFRT